MKLAITSNAYLPHVCGVSNLLKDTTEILTKEYGYDITIYVPNWTNSPSKEDTKKLHIRRFPYKYIMRNYCVSFPLFNEIRKKKFDIIHSHNFGYFPAFAGFVASRLNRTPHILTPHYHPPIYGGFRKSLLWVYNITQGLPMLRFSEKVLPITEYQKKLLCKIGATPKNMEVLPNMLDTSKFKPSKKSLPFKTKEKIVLRLGTFTHDKGADAAFNIAKNIVKKRDDVSFIFVGKKGDLEAGIKKEAKKFDKNTFIFLKNISEEQLINLYSNADVTISTAVYEAFCIILAESLSCKTPAVAAKVGGIPEVIKDKKAGFLVNYGDWKKFEEKILLLLDNNKLNKRFGEFGRHYIVENFERKKILKRLVSIYESVLNSKK